MSSPQLASLVARAAESTNLPEIPETAYQLIQELEKEEPNVAALERLIHTDPAITAMILRCANSAQFGLAPGSMTTIHGAIGVLGFRNLHSLAVSAWVQSAFSRPDPVSKLDVKRFSAHGAFVGFLSKYLLSRAQRQHGMRSAYTLDELFAVAVMHDLGLGAFAFIDTKLCGEFHALAEAKKVSVATAFQSALGGPIEALGLAAANAWRLPQKFQDMLGYFAGTVESVDPLASQALGYANFVAEGNEFGLHAWNPASSAAADSFELVALPEDEVAEVVVMIQQYVDERSKAA